MGEIFPPKPVLPIVAVTSKHADAFQWAKAQTMRRFGSELFSSAQFSFHQTDYYRESMGEGLSKQFLVPAQLMDPVKLASWKIETNRWETEFAAQNRLPESRPVNLDPGYITEDKLVLASTKNHAHRLYLADGIYAEITLQYRGKRWQPCPWTYPDYREPDFIAFFDECRQKLRSLLRDHSHPA